MIDNEILQQRAAKLHLVATDEEVDAKLAQMKAPYTQEEFNQRLKSFRSYRLKICAGRFAKT